MISNHIFSTHVKNFGSVVVRQDKLGVPCGPNSAIAMNSVQSSHISVGALAACRILTTRF